MMYTYEYLRRAQASHWFSTWFLFGFFLPILIIERTLRRIIPFVAADAVVDGPAPAYEAYQPIVERVYNVSDVTEERPASLVVNSFSPPAETEGQQHGDGRRNGGNLKPLSRLRLSLTI